MNDLRAKLAALFRRVTSPDVSDDDAFAALREFRSLGCTRREIDDALAPTPSSVKQVTAAPVLAPTPTPQEPRFKDPTMPYGSKYGPSSPKSAWPLSRIAREDAQYLRFLLDRSDPPPKPWLRAQIEMALAGAKAEPKGACQQPPCPAGDDADVPYTDVPY